MGFTTGAHALMNWRGNNGSNCELIPAESTSNPGQGGHDDIILIVPN
jgi:hypothetical protein